MKARRALAGALVVVGFITVQAVPRIPAQGAEAISGVVSSPDEGKMEGVVISARMDGGNSTVSVVSDRSGSYKLPRTHLKPGGYRLTVRAAGYDLSDPGVVTVADGKVA